MHLFRKDQPPNEEICSQQSVQRMPGPLGSGPAVASDSVSWEGGVGFWGAALDTGSCCLEEPDRGASRRTKAPPQGGMEGGDPPTQKVS